MALVRKQLKPVPVVEDKEITVLLNNLGSDFSRPRAGDGSPVKNRRTGVAGDEELLSDGVPLEVRKRLERLVEQTTSHAAAPLLRGLRAR